MTDDLTKAQRSYNMSRIKGKDTKPELVLRQLLTRKGLRGYRIHYSLPGKPDIVFVSKKIAVFVDGCFWHKCSRCFVEPRTRTRFWMEKIGSNVERDKRTNRLLARQGWQVLRVWEHEIKKDAVKVASRIMDQVEPGY